MKTALITGGAGFIGSHLAATLINARYNVIILDNFATGKKTNINPKAHVFSGDVRKKKDITGILRSHHVDVVLHIAGQASTITSFTNPKFDVAVNFNGTMNVVLSCVQYKVRRLLFASSMVAYGHPLNLPVAESEPCRPICYYGISKYAAERFVHATSERNDLPAPLRVTSFRMFNVYGPRQSLTNPYQGAMAIFIGNILRNEPITIYGDGKQSRDFVYIDDVIRAWLGAMDNKASFGKVFNIGFGKRTSINKLVETIIRAFGKDPATYPIRHKKERPGDQRHMEADMRLAKKTLSFKPAVPLSTGVRRTIEWAQGKKSS